MKNVLKISSSILGDNSVSAGLLDELLEALFNIGEAINGEASNGDEIKVVDRDFSKEAIPHMDASWLEALSTPAADRSKEQQSRVDFSDSLIAEVKAADSIVIALPMYNFSVPSMLKAWIDHIARAGVTFAYTESGAKGLLENKAVYLVATMGGVHERHETDFLRPYMELIMGFIGLDQVHIVTANGLNMGEEARAAGLASARKEIAELGRISSRQSSLIKEEAA